MKLEKIEAFKMIDEKRGLLPSDRWIDHQICVGNTAGILAKELGLDEDLATTLGYIHDIGKIYNEPDDGALVHGINGYHYLKELGYDELYARICILHSYLNNDIDCLASHRTNRQGKEFEFQRDYVENHVYTEYEKLINLCDLMCTTKTLTMEKRLIDLLTRHGVFETTEYHLEKSLELKRYFDNKLGRNLYDYIPDIKNNL